MPNALQTLTDNETLPMGYYHYLTTRIGQGILSRVIGSAATNADEAHNERSKIVAQYHPKNIVALTTHEKGTGPAPS